MNILERDRSGQPVSSLETEYSVISEIVKETGRVIFEINSAYHDDEEMRRLFAKLTGVEVDGSLIVRPPFYADFGRNIRMGRNVFINHGCTFMDRGGITLEDDVLIAPKVNLVTLNHLLDPAERRTTVCSPITIKRNAWIGLGATIMPGVTVGENAVVAASALVTRDVPANTVVVGIPAKTVRHIDGPLSERHGQLKGAV